MTPKDALLHISQQAFLDEVSHIQHLLPQVEHFHEHYSRIRTKALSYIETGNATLKKQSHLHFPTQEFLQEYGLDTEEGVMMMCLAEALLRIPDKATVDALIHDKLASSHWESHLKHSESPLVNASTYGLLIAGRVVSLASKQISSISQIPKHLVQKMGEPVVREALKAMIRLMGNSFVLGETIEQALHRAQSYQKKNYLFSYDMLGEGARSEQQAQDFFDSYIHAIETISKTTDKTLPLYHKPGISIKLSALDPHYDLLHENTVQERLYPRLKNIIQHAMEQGLSITLDAEEAARLDTFLYLFTLLIQDPVFKNFDGLGVAVQAYQKRAPFVLEYLKDLAHDHHKRIAVRLVKGAYWDAEIKRAQQLGLPHFPVFTRKSHTDVSYLACAKILLDNTKLFYPQFATHNALTIASILHYAPHHPFEFQRLHGMGEDVYDTLLKNSSVPCRIYAPVGSYENLLSYLIRRILENSANSSFLHMLAGNHMDAALEDPVARAHVTGGILSPLTLLPEHLYADRTNSSGTELGNRYQLDQLLIGISPYTTYRWSAAPLINGKKREQTPALDITSPANSDHHLGTVRYANREHCLDAMTSAHQAFFEWNQKPVTERATLLETFAHILEEHRNELMALCMLEAGKTMADSIAEIREAIDFCRYYAVQARKLLEKPALLAGVTGEENRLHLQGRGVFLCISPWNFPLAIFLGQITAALVTGNTVIAKPAEQTSLIAQRTIELMLEAGFPPAVIHLLPGVGATLGETLIPDPRIAGIVFTGSTETAQKINRIRAATDAPLIPFIAETGGQNCMIVDSSALIEQAVDDIMLSAFGSTGERCSALRVLYVQEDIADKLITLLKGAMQALVIGHPLQTSTDLGPVIDKEAHTMLLSHITLIQQTALQSFSTPIPATLTQGYFIAPHAFEIRSIKELSKEIFGPILHIIRFRNKDLDKVIDEINGTGYGLTFGIHSRITEKVEMLCQQIHAGNIYVNRSMIGATVGVQPFGGEGLSGTGPKAGGPYYLQRFCIERTRTINTAAIGGNSALLNKAK